MSQNLRWRVVFSFLLFSLLFLPVVAWGLVSQALVPDKTTVTVYQGINRAWIGEVVSPFLFAGENQILFPREDLAQKRFLVFPLSPAVEVERLERTSGGQKIYLNAAEEGQSQLFVGFFEEGFDWVERYLGFIQEGKEELLLIPSVLVVNQNSRSWEKVSLSWLLGSPLLEEEVLAMELLSKSRAEGAKFSDSYAVSALPVMERVSEYQLFTFPQEVDILPRSLWQVFLPAFSFPFEEVVRFKMGEVERILTFTNQEEPLPSGELQLFWGKEIAESEFFPGARLGEELEFALKIPTGVFIERRVVDYRRQEARFNQDREVVAFLSSREIEFELQNQREEEITLQLVEEVYSLGELTLSEGWQWKNNQAWRELTLSPGEEKTVVLSYQFEEALP